MLDLTGKKALVTGIANNRSIAWGIAQQLHAAGAEIGVTYLPDEKGRAEKKVRDLTEPLNPSLFLPCNVQDDDQVDALFSTIKDKWGSFDILIHCLAFANRDDSLVTSAILHALALTWRSVSVPTPWYVWRRGQSADARRRQYRYAHLPGRCAGDTQLQRHGHRQGRAGDECALSGG